MRRRAPKVHPWERAPIDTKEREDTVKKLFYSLNIITHIQTNILRYRNHICHKGLHVCIIPHHSRTKLHFCTCSVIQLQVHSFYIVYALSTSYMHWPGVFDHFAPCLDQFPAYFALFLQKRGVETNFVIYTNFLNFFFSLLSILINNSICWREINSNSK
jgi:hypothetical protein